MRRNCAKIAVLVALVALAGCGSSRDRNKEPVIAQAYTGPVTLNLREEITPKSRTAVTTHHGDRLDVLQIRRRFVRVRTQDGKQGWTEMRNLLNDEQMKALADLGKAAAKLPSQGQATVYEALNVHTEPSRPSMSFYQIREGMKVDVLDQQLVERTNDPPPPAIQLKKPERRVVRKKKQPAIPPPPRPPAPGLPVNWQEISKTVLPPEPEPEPEPGLRGRRSGPPKPVFEEWTLVRTEDGHAGWVLTRNLVMAIPDEVAQYSEGARITSYFPLAEVRDGEAVKHHWLWTTSRGPGSAHHFDSFRVFIYMLRRHRYETAYIERNVEGYYPVEVEHGAVPKFSLILRGADGKLYRKTWALEGYVTRKIAEQPYEKPAIRALPGTSNGEEDGQSDEEAAQEAERENLTLMDRVRRFFRLG